MSDGSSRSFEASIFSLYVRVFAFYRIVFLKWTHLSPQLCSLHSCFHVVPRSTFDETVDRLVGERTMKSKRAYGLVVYRKWQLKMFDSVSTGMSDGNYFRNWCYLPCPYGSAVKITTIEGTFSSIEAIVNFEVNVLVATMSVWRALFRRTILCLQPTSSG